MKSHLDQVQVHDDLVGVVDLSRRQLFDIFLERYGPFLSGDSAPLPSPYYTLNAGTIGISYVLYELYLLEQRPNFITAADRILTRTHQERETLSHPEELSSLQAQTALFHSYSGLWFVHALVASECDLSSVQLYLDRFVSMAAQPKASFDVSFGNAGFLLASVVLLRRVDGISGVRLDGLRSLAAEYYRELAQLLDADLENQGTFGFAHGFAGVLYAVLRYVELLDLTEVCPGLRWIDNLTKYATRVGGGATWPRVRGLADQEWAKASWCNGSAGMAHVYILAYDLYGREEDLQLAQEAAYVAGNGISGAYNLCCGNIGQAYSLLKVFARTRNRIWSRRANELVELAAQKAIHYHPGLHGHAGFDMDGLFSGIGGIVLLHAQMDKGGDARMPVLDDPNVSQKSGVNVGY